MNTATPALVSGERAYTFDQLPDDAKMRVIDDHRDVNVDGIEWWDGVYMDAEHVAGLLGITVERIFFSGFWSQGDGACFTGLWDASDVQEPGAAHHVKEHAPQDEKLHEIAASIDDLIARASACTPSARISHRHGNYCHEHSVSIDVEGVLPDDYDEWSDFERAVYDAAMKAHNMDTFEDDVADVLRNFMCWVYRRLEDEHDYLTSDEHVAEWLSEQTTLYDENGDTL